MKARHTFRGAVLRGAPRTHPTARSAIVPTPTRIRVRVGREVAGRSGKGVSVISGLPLGPADLDVLASALKKRCGAGGAVKDGVIEIQGDHRDRLVSELCKLGYEARRSGG
ncbi:MAG: translation initiation factor [Steroidobacteraceae bacterium]